MKSLTSHYLGHLRVDHERAKRELLYGNHLPEELDFYRIQQEKERKQQQDVREEAPYATPDIPLHPRFEGTWVVGLPGTGKTQLFQYFLMADLDMVARGEASIVIIDPNVSESFRLSHTRSLKFDGPMKQKKSAWSQCS